jgi:anti-sigma B factor antagonist
VPGIRYPAMINGLPVVSAPVEIDVTTAEKLRLILREASANGHATIVVDLTGTRFCDSFGLRALGAAHRRALDEGGELRLVLPAGGPVVAVLALTSLDRFIPSFTGLDQALDDSRPSHRRQPGRPADGRAPLVHGTLEASVAAGDFGPIIILAGKADRTSHTQLAEVLDAQLSSQATHLTIEASRLCSADSDSIRALAAAAVILRHRGGDLILMHPQQSVLRMLTTLGADQMLTIRGEG